jgi:hypothetical protein
MPSQRRRRYQWVGQSVSQQVKQPAASQPAKRMDGQRDRPFSTVSSAPHSPSPCHLSRGRSGISRLAASGVALRNSLTMDVCVNCGQSIRMRTPQLLAPDRPGEVYQARLQQHPGSVVCPDSSRGNPHLVLFGMQNRTVGPYLIFRIGQIQSVVGKHGITQLKR